MKSFDKFTGRGIVFLIGGGREQSVVSFSNAFTGRAYKPKDASNRNHFPLA
jgi:hypothetical protein